MIKILVKQRSYILSLNPAFNISRKNQTYWDRLILHSIKNIFYHSSSNLNASICKKVQVTKFYTSAFYFRLLHWLSAKFLNVTVHGQMIIFTSKSLVFYVVLPSNLWITLSVKFVILFLCRYNNVNINVAVQTDNGLFVPVIRVSKGSF